MTIRTVLLNIFLLGIYGLSAQQPPSSATEDPFEKAYQKRITQDFLFNVYIPKDLTDAFIQLNKLIDKDSKIKFKNVEEAEAMSKLHFSLGRWMIYNWGFYEGSRLSYFLNQLGISEPDDMARFIIITYHRNLNKKKLDVKALIDLFQAEQLRKKEERQKSGTVIHEEKRQRPKEPEGKKKEGQ